MAAGIPVSERNGPMFERTARMALDTQHHLSPAVQELLRRNREEAAHFREQHGDPLEALERIVREHYDPDVLLDVYNNMLERGIWFEDSEELDEP